MLYTYLFSMAATLAVVVAAGWLAMQHRQSRLRYEAVMADLPEVERLPAAKAELVQIDRAIAVGRKERLAAERVIEQRVETERWLERHRPLREQIAAEMPAIESRRDAARTEFEELSLRRDELGREVRELRIACDGLVGDERRLADAAERARREETRARSEAEAYAAREAGLAANVEEITARLESRQDELREADERLPRLRQEAAAAALEVGEGRAHVEAIRRQQRDLSEQLPPLEARVVAARSKAEKLESDHAALERQAEALRANEAEALRQAETAQGLAEDRQNLLAALSAEVEQVRAEHARRKAEVEQFKIQHENLLRLLDAAEARWSQIGPVAGASDEHRLSELWSPVLPEPSPQQRTWADEAACLADFEAKLEADGLRFPQRVIRALHTSLKTADLSPLTVLAGVSGTGKSLLPRLYADHVGMHFLPMAVQPRWDSPQDMFGFFSHLEGRYRATELARALVQMDPFAEEAGRGWDAPAKWHARHSRSDGLLLVLLDEMNLARVEYYFSEFLSRLETRRAVNERDPLQRRRAEVMLEVGLRVPPADAKTPRSGDFCRRRCRFSSGATSCSLGR